MSALRDQCASNRLYRGQITNAREAIQTHILALREERDIQRSLEAQFPPAEGEPRLDFSFDTAIEEAQKCLQVYDSIVGDAERRLAEGWRDSIDETHRLIADAILSGDYSGLAI